MNHELLPLNSKPVVTFTSLLYRETGLFCPWENVTNVCVWEFPCFQSAGSGETLCIQQMKLDWARLAILTKTICRAELYWQIWLSGINTVALCVCVHTQGTLLFLSDLETTPWAKSEISFCVCCNLNFSFLCFGVKSKLLQHLRKACTTGGELLFTQGALFAIVFHINLMMQK